MTAPPSPAGQADTDAADCPCCGARGVVWSGFICADCCRDGGLGRS